MRAQTPLRRAAPVLMLLLARPGAAQPPQPAQPTIVKVGDPAVDGSFIKPYKNAWKITRLMPDGKSLDGGTWTDEMTVVEDHGRSLLKRLQIEKLPRGTFTTLNLVDQRTLAPILSDETDDRGYHVRLEFVDPTHVKAEHVGGPGAKPGGPVKKEDLTLAMPAFDFLGGMYGMLLVGFPLHEGYSARLPIFLDQGDKVDWLTFTVGAKESVPAGPGKRVDAWRVTTENGGYKMLFHLTKEAPYVIRLEQTGPRGGRSVFEMI
jgi:hypothetical protein